MIIFILLTSVYSLIPCENSQPITITNHNISQFANCAQIHQDWLTISCDDNNQISFNITDSIIVNNLTVNCKNILFISTNITINSIYETENQTDQSCWIYLIANYSLQLNNIMLPNYAIVVASNNLQFQLGSQLQALEFAAFSNYSIALTDLQMHLSRRICEQSEILSSTVPLILNVIPTFQDFNVSNITMKQAQQTILNQSWEIDISSMTSILNAFLRDNFTVILVTNQNINLINSSISGSQMTLNAQNITIDVNSLVLGDYLGCSVNQGIGRGPLFYTLDTICGGNGGSNSAYGGVGLFISEDILTTCNQTSFEESLQCLYLTNSTRLQFSMYPYVPSVLRKGSGGGMLTQAVSSDSSSGGGGIMIRALTALKVDGQISANGQKGLPIQIVIQGIIYSLNQNGLKKQKTISGGGSGGSIFVNYGLIFGSGKFLAQGGDAPYCQGGEGSGGFIEFLPISWNPTENDFEGRVSVSKGMRELVGSQSELFLAQDGIIKSPGCEPYQFFNATTFNCMNCSISSYKISFYGNCVECPDQTFQDNSFCAEQSSSLESFESITNCILGNQGNQLKLYISKGLYMILIIIAVLFVGVVIREFYKYREKKNEKIVNFDLVTKGIISDEIITEKLIEAKTFQFGDLLYHAHRINVLGNNTFESPWLLHHEPPADIAYALDKNEYFKFASRFNKISRWVTWQKYLLYIMAICYYPAYWAYKTKLKKKKYKLIEAYINSKDIKFFKFLTSDENNNFTRMKITKSDDYTLLYLDIFNYKNSDLKYIYLTCPFIIFLSGEGNYIRPFYICQSDTFLLSLYFAVNKKSKTIDSRFKILDNLVGIEKRTFNSQQIKKFLKKFNRISMTIDFGGEEKIISQNIKCLYDYLQKWNDKFFSRYNVKIELLVIQTPLDLSQNYQTITIISIIDAVKFQKFIADILNNFHFIKYIMVYFYIRTMDIRFGIFIFSMDQEPEELNEALKNQRISLLEEKSLSLQQFGFLEESAFDPHSLKERFIERNLQSCDSPISKKKQEINYKSGKDEQGGKQRNKLMLRVLRVVNILRYGLMSHKQSNLNKYSMCLVLCNLVLLDNICLILLVCGIDKEVYLSSKLMMVLLPYPLSLILGPIFGTIWISTQSYGILRTYLIFNAMSISTIILNLYFSVYWTLESVKVFDIVLKLTISYVGTRMIPMNSKLNHLGYQNTAFK